MKTHPGNYLALALAALTLHLSVVQPSQAASWVTNSPMTTARAFQTVTLLPNGKVLVAGGQINGGATNTAELYDPATGTWTATGPLITARLEHTATLLRNGKVLVAGGVTGKPPRHSYLASAELYDPATGIWTATGAMHVQRCVHTATLLVNGKVLVAGGYYDDTLHGTAYLDGTEIYDPDTGTWRVITNPLNIGRSDHTATLLPDGKVLAAGGCSSTGSLASAELFDPTSETWTATNSLNSPRFSHTATLLPNGKVLVAGGDSGSDNHLSSAELFDSASGTWTPTGSLNTARCEHTATLLPSGLLLIAGGFGNSGCLSSAELYNPISGTWTTTNTLTFARRSHTATLLPSGQVLVVGGLTTSYVPLSSTEVYDSAIGTWTATGTMDTARSGSTATLLSNWKVLVVGGRNGNVMNNGGYLSTAELFDPTVGTWTATDSLTASRRGHTATLLMDGRLLVTGGWGGPFGSILSSMELYDPASGLWTATNGPITPRTGQSATLLPNGNVLIAGGFNGASSLWSAELYVPASGTWKTTGRMTTIRSGHTATMLPNGKILVAGGNANTVYLSSAELYDPATAKWTATASMTTARANHSATLLPNGKVLVVGGGNGNSLVSAELYNPTSEAWTATGPLPTNALFSDHKAILLANGNVLAFSGSHAALYDPASGTWQDTAPLNIVRYGSAVALLPDGKVLAVGGVGDGLNNCLSSAELYDVGLGYTNSWRPQIATVTSPLNLGGSLVITGSQFRGVSGGSGGNSQDSSTDYPLVQLRRLDNEQTTFLLTTNWSTNSFTSLPVWNFPAGYALATVFVNGIQSTSSVVNISVPVPTAATLTSPQQLTNGFRFAFTNSVGALFGMLTTTNLALPLTNWMALGGVIEISPGQFQFTDPQATNDGQRFYRAYAP
jgi:uncharacterized delta-60 repeat protein